MKDLATEFEKRIVNLDGVLGTSRAILTFTDGSRLEFELASTPVEPAKATGSVSSYANRFASSVQSFTMKVDAFEFTFSDGSRIAYDLTGAVVSSRSEPVGFGRVPLRRNLKTASASRKRTAPVFAFSMLVLALGMAWYCIQGPCGVNRVETATALLNAQHARYEQALASATTASPVNLELLLAKLEQIQQNTAQIGVPLCMVDAKTELEFSIVTILQLAHASPGDKTGAQLDTLIDASMHHSYMYIEEISEIDQCKPFCQDEYPEGPPGESFVPHWKEDS